MSNTVSNGQNSTVILKKAKMSEDISSLHLDAIPPDTLTKVHELRKTKKQKLVFLRLSIKSERRDAAKETLNKTEEQVKEEKQNTP